MRVWGRPAPPLTLLDEPPRLPPDAGVAQEPPLALLQDLALQVVLLRDLQGQTRPRDPVTRRCGGGSPSPGGPLRTRRRLPSAGFGGSEAKDPWSPRATRRPAPQGPTVGARLRPHGRGCWREHEGCAGPDLPTDCPHLKREAGRRGALTGSAFAPRCQRAEASSETGAPGAASVSSCGLCAPGGRPEPVLPRCGTGAAGGDPPGGRAGKG